MCTAGRLVIAAAGAVGLSMMALMAASGAEVGQDVLRTAQRQSSPPAEGGGGGPPANDNCANRIPIFNGKTPFDNTGASFDGPTDPGGVPCQSNMTSDVWWNYTADFTGTVNIDTCQSTGIPTNDTTLVVYDGCDCATIHCGIDGLPGGVLAQNDDACAPPGGGNAFLSSVKVPVVAGNCYKIQVGGWDGGGMDPAPCIFW